MEFIPRADKVKAPLICFAVTMIVVSLAPIAKAVWPDDPTVNLAVCALTRDQHTPRAIPDGSSGAIVVWQDYRNLEYDIYAQRIGSDGTLMWGGNGVPICTAGGTQEFPEIASDGVGGAIITWVDRRAEVDIYAQRVDATGAVQWATDGVVVCDITGSQNQIQIVTDESEGAVVAWTDGRNGLPDIFAQRIGSDGARRWPSDGLEVCVDSHDQVEPQLASDGSGGAIVAWVDGRGLQRPLYTQWIGPLGSAVWPTDGVSVTDTSVNQDEHRLVSVAPGAAVVTWADQRANSIDIYAQRLGTGGYRQWGQNGLGVCIGPETADTPRTVPDGSGGAIVAWYDYRSGNADIYAQMISAGGSVRLAINGKAVCSDLSEQIFVRVAPDGFGGAVIAWQDYRNPLTRPDIYASRLGAGGSVFWEPAGVAISTASDTQDNSVIVSDSRGGAILAWTDNRGADRDVYAQQVGSNGKLGEAVAVLITGFEGRPVADGVELEWDLHADEEVAGFRIYKRRSGETAEYTVNFELIPTAHRRYLDRSVGRGVRYFYTLAAVRPDGSQVRSQTVTVVTPAGAVKLDQNVPNPFNPGTTISLVLPVATRASLSIFNTEGKLVTTLADRVLPEGRSQFFWDGRDSRGNPVSSGVYYCLLTAGKRTHTLKMVLIR